MRSTKIKKLFALIVYGHVDMFTSYMYGHIKKPKKNHRFFDDFGLRQSL